MKLNRWTILAAILLLSTAVGLLFRPWSIVEPELRTVDENGLQLTCPESVAASFGSLTTFECHVVNNSRAQGNSSIGMSIDRGFGAISRQGFEIQEVSENEYNWKPRIAARKGRMLLVDASVFDPSSQLRINQVSTQIDVNVQLPLVFYTGLGLSAIQALLLVIWPVAEALVVVRRALWRYKRFPGTRLDALKAALPGTFLVYPVLRYFSGRRAERLTIHSGIWAYNAVDSFWISLIVQPFIILAVHVIDLIVVDSRMGINPTFPIPFILIVTIPLGIGSAVGLYFLREASFGKVKLREGRYVPSDTDSDPDESLWLNPFPFVGAVVVGGLSVPLAIYVYWFVWLKWSWGWM